MSDFDSDENQIGSTPSETESESDWSAETTSEEEASQYSRDDLDDPNLGRIINTGESPVVRSFNNINIEKASQRSTTPPTPQLSTIGDGILDNTRMDMKSSMMMSQTSKRERKNGMPFNPIRFVADALRQIATRRAIERESIRFQEEALFAEEKATLDLLHEEE